MLVLLGEVDVSNRTLGGLKMVGGHGNISWVWPPLLS